MNDLQLRSLVDSAPAPTKAKPKVAAAGQLLTVGQVAFRLQLHESTVIKLITTGSIPALCVRAGKRKKTFRVREEALEKWIMSQERDPGAQLSAKGVEMPGMSFKKANRDAQRKAKAQRKQEKRNETKADCGCGQRHFQTRRSGIDLAVAESRRRSVSE